ncbi:MAG: hypothetical protein JWM43_3626 [Acidobacteriaceae bacterium]|nr:hypothetical protein [Acidobacteriaceae bacterium]
MQTLFAISVLCFLGVLWAALALARRIKATQMQSQMQTMSHTPSILQLQGHAAPVLLSDFKEHFLAAAEASPVRPTIVRETLPQTLATVAPRIRVNDLNQSVREIAANKHWTLPVHPLRLPLRRVGRGQQSEPTTALLAARKPPQPAPRHGIVQRIDPAFFNKDLGDLTDPYQPPHLRANSQNRRD